MNKFIFTSGTYIMSLGEPETTYMYKKKTVTDIGNRQLC